MSRKTYITNGNIESKIVNGIYEIEAPYPPISEDNITIFREFLTLNGDGVTNSMRVDGSITNRHFYIEANPEYDIYITALSFYLGSELTIIDLIEFGNLPALTNGCQLIFKSNQLGEVILGDPIKSNFDLLKICNFKPNFGNAGAAFELNNATATTSEGYSPVLYFSDYGFNEDGILLLNGTTDKLTFKIRDNLNVGLSSISKFDVIAQGFKRKI